MRNQAIVYRASGQPRWPHAEGAEHDVSPVGAARYEHNAASLARREPQRSLAPLEAAQPQARPGPFAEHAARQRVREAVDV